jgi:hypothetical protein
MDTYTKEEYDKLKDVLVETFKFANRLMVQNPVTLEEWGNIIIKVNKVLGDKQL